MQAPLTFLLISFFLLTIPHSKAQVTLSYHLSDLSFVGVNTMIGERFMPELRMGVSRTYDNVDGELNILYLFKNKSDVQWYGGLGIRSRIFEGLVIPTGLNFYPLENKNFGFQMELATVIGENDALFRGSVGIRYRFDKKEKKRE